MRRFPQVPSVNELRNPALIWVAGREYYNTDELKSMLSKHFELSPEVLALRHQNNGRQAFSVQVDWLTASWTEQGYHIEMSKKHYRLTDHGRRIAQSAIQGA
jgi:hypothetical protein